MSFAARRQQRQSSAATSSSSSGSFPDMSIYHMGALVAQGQPYVQLKSIKTTPNEAKASQLSGEKCKLTTRVDFVGHAQSACKGATGTAIVQHSADSPHSTPPLALSLSLALSGHFFHFAAFICTLKLAKMASRTATALSLSLLAALLTLTSPSSLPLSLSTQPY